MDCLVLPALLIKKGYAGSRLGYRPLNDGGFAEFDSPVTVVVGKEKREFLVDPHVLQESPFRLLIEMANKDDVSRERRFLNARKEEKRVIFVDVDAMLFEHMLWLKHNDCPSLFQLNLEEIIDFYGQDC
uniref:Uncharacterized protein n=1 Tax=Rhizophora mucronata TaxID=61149 RepID=A0A2P2NHI8_RHIMU